MARMDEGDGMVAVERTTEAPPRARTGSVVAVRAGIGVAAPSSVWPLRAAVRRRTEGDGAAGAACGAGGEARCLRRGTRVPARVASAARRVVAERGGDSGAATAEYAIATMAAVAFAGLLVVILQSDEVRGMLLDLVRRALTYDR
jgi:hypothetical protein